uniref:Ribosomal protein L9 domain-containing protein n=1 Tax=Pseudo-nitzschia australis TaxID=44445 RepID=A0A7S4AG08_9STRA|mmetsp:Transcript_24257/g.53085  ORF Transcript_24257/g.53085 Transcript_24257/m.53085 type:complete len:288 (+) Transcript_24257:198-1061(+)
MTTTKAMFLSACWVSAVILTATIQTSQAWTTTTTTITTPRSLCHAQTTTTTRAASSSSTALFGKKKKKKSGGSNSSSSTKMQVKLLQHIPGTGQAGDVIMVNAIFFANKLRPEKLARAITDEEVRKDAEAKKEKSDALQAEAKALKELLDDTSDDDSSSSFVLEFLDNQTGPDGKKLFGGIGPKKLMESLRKDCKEFESYSKKFTKQVSVQDVEEQEVVEIECEEKESAYKDYSAAAAPTEQNEKEVSVSYSSLPKSDKMTIKHTGVFRIKVSLTKDMFAKVKVVVE